jgi:hypothetical protein
MADPGLKSRFVDEQQRDAFAVPYRGSEPRVPSDVAELRLDRARLSRLLEAAPRPDQRDAIGRSLEIVSERLARAERRY